MNCLWNIPALSILNQNTFAIQIAYKSITLLFVYVVLRLKAVTTLNYNTNMYASYMFEIINNKFMNILLHLIFMRCVVVIVTEPEEWVFHQRRTELPNDQILITLLVVQ